MNREHGVMAVVVDYGAVCCRVLKLRRCWIVDDGCIHLQHILRMEHIGLQQLFLDYNL